METIWFAIVAFMLAMYVVLDGFDLGAGIVHLFVAKKDDERRIVLNSIGPVWDGNEVWLLATGGTLYLAFPKLYASSFSGFYLPLIIMLWLFMFRGLGIEFRHHSKNPLWRSFWDVMFSFSSILLSIFFGAALGNVVRGVPLDATGYFFAPLWTTFTITTHPGILDWYTIILGLVSFFVLTLHGATFLAMKTTKEVHAKSQNIVSIVWWFAVTFSAIALFATSIINPMVWNNFSNNIYGYTFPIIALASIFGIKIFNSFKKDNFAFLSSSTFIISMLATTAFGLYPTVLPSSIDPKYSLTIFNTSTSAYGYSVALTWWVFGLVLTLSYFVFLFRTMKGKVVLPNEEEGY